MARKPALRPDTLYYGDCLEVVAGWPDEAIDLIYLDPPFNSKQDFSMLFGDAGNGKTAQVMAFEDSWHWGPSAAERVERIQRAIAHPANASISGLHGIVGDSGMMSYLSYMAERLAELRRVLKPNGTIYLHCDPTASHYLKVLMDDVFGAERFRNEVVWRRTKGRSDALGWGAVHDCLLMYAGEGKTWNPQYLAHTDEHVSKEYKHTDERGRWMTDNLTAPGLVRKGESGKAWRGIDPSARGNHWGTPVKGGMSDWIREQGIIPGWPDEVGGVHARLDALDAAGLIHWPQKAGGMPRLKRYLASTKGRAIDDVVVDIGKLEANAAEKLGYPTQKPLALLRRIIAASSNPGDLVCDPFCGCGTTIEAANSLDRRFVGIDLQPFALELVRSRRLPGTLKVGMEGLPRDLSSARKLHRAAPLKFEAWAISRIHGFEPNERQQGDRGIDGRAKLVAKDAEGRDLVLAQVKGSYTATGMDQFLHTLDRENAAVGVFVTLDKQGQGARVRASRAGKRSVGADHGPRCVVWSIEEMFEEGTPADLPTLADPRTGQALLG